MHDAMIGPQETIFQIYYPAEEKPENWGPLSAEDATREGLQLVERLRADGWHEDFLAPIVNASSVIR